MGFSHKEYRSGLPFLCPGDHILSEFFTTACLSWVTRHRKAHLIASLSYANPFPHTKAVIHEGDELGKADQKNCLHITSKKTEVQLDDLSMSVSDRISHYSFQIHCPPFFPSSLLHETCMNSIKGLALCWPLG